MRTTQAALLSRFFLCEAIMQLASAEIYLAMDCFAMCPMKLNSHPATPEQRVTTTSAEKHVFDCSLSRHWHWHGWRSRRAKWLLMPPCGLRKACLDSCASPRKVCTEKNASWLPWQDSHAQALQVAQQALCMAQTETRKSFAKRSH